MMTTTDFVDGWEVRDRADGSYGVYDGHGMVSGPYGSKTEALGAALRLPKSMTVRAFLDQHLGPAISSPRPLKRG